MNPEVRLDKFENQWYKSGKNFLIRTAWYFLNGILINSYLIPMSSFKVLILRLFGAKIGKNVIIKPMVNIKYPWRLSIGDNSWIGENVWIDNLADVNIGDNCCISQDAMLLTGNHNYKRSNFDLMIGKINICSGAWVGARSTVCPGVTLGKSSILSVGSVCSSNIDENLIYRGNPAVSVKTRIIQE